MNMPAYPTIAIEALRSIADDDGTIDEYQAMKLIEYIDELEELAQRYVDLSQ